MENPNSPPIFQKLLKPHMNIGVGYEELNIKENSL
jgi:preprotein translocase subunit SecB